MLWNGVHVLLKKLSLVGPILHKIACSGGGYFRVSFRHKKRLKMPQNWPQVALMLDLEGVPKNWVYAKNN